MNKEREEVYQILELGKDEKNLHHKKRFGGLLFIDLSMIKFSKLSSYIRRLDKENQKLNKQLEEYQKALDKTMSEKIDIQNNCNKLKEIIKKKQDYYRHFKDNRYRKFLSELLDKMQEIEQGSDK